MLTTTDLDVGVSGSVEANVEKEGSTTLPVKRLVSIIRELPASEVEVAVDSKNHATIKSGPSFFKIIGLGEDEFPPLLRKHPMRFLRMRPAMCSTVFTFLSAQER